MDASEAPGVGGIFASIRVIVLDERWRFKQAHSWFRNSLISTTWSLFPPNAGSDAENRGQTVPDRPPERHLHDRLQTNT